MTIADETMGKIATIIHDLAPTGDDRLDQRLGELATREPARLSGDVLTLIRVVRRQRDEIGQLRAELTEIRAAAVDALVTTPHPDDVFAAALDALGAALHRAHDDPARVADVVLASQAVYAAGQQQIRYSVDQVAVQLDQATQHVETRLDTIDRQIGRLRSEGGVDLELHDLRNKIQGAMDGIVMLEEQRHAIEALYAQLQALSVQLTQEVALREQLAKRIGLVERAVGERIP